MRAIRWGDHDRHLGPLLFSWNDSYRSLALILKSWGGGDADDGPSYLRISLVWFTVILQLPPILRPQRRKVFPGWDAAIVKRLGRDWYWDVEVREYGFSYSDGFLIVHYGICPGDSTKDQNWGWHLPWKQWRHIRRSLYGLCAEHIWTETDADQRAKIAEGTWRDRWEVVREWEARCPVAKFEFEDHDGEKLIATCRMEEREWRFGTGWFKWLSWFRRARIKRYLNLEFSGETGPEKGSWKGGTTGTSIEMRPLELHEEAFRRYCDQEHRSKYRPYRVKYVGPWQPAPQS